MNVARFCLLAIYPHSGTLQRNKDFQHNHGDKNLRSYSVAPLVNFTTLPHHYPSSRSGFDQCLDLSSNRHLPVDP